MLLKLRVLWLMKEPSQLGVGQELILCPLLGVHGFLLLAGESSVPDNICRKADACPRSNACLWPQPPAECDRDHFLP